ncbi:hypothetical protein [Pseudorhizobium flavum]|nr:hypothetical protein [Pseudorhizobium flavum]
MAMVSPDEPIIIDLADILFSEGPQHPRALFESDGYGAIVPSFSSDESCFSYLKITAGLVIEAREKQVISSHASAGVYMFATSGIFLTAAAHSIAHRDSLAVNNNLFICPMINGVIAAGHTVIAPNITDYHPIGKIFHSL